MVMIFLWLLHYYHLIERNSHWNPLSPLKWISASESPSHIITSSTLLFSFIIGWNLVVLTPWPLDSHQPSCEDQALPFYGLKLPIPEETLFTKKKKKAIHHLQKPKSGSPAKIRAHILSNCSLPLQSSLLPTAGDRGEMKRNLPQKRLQCQTLQILSQRQSGVCQALYLFLAHAHAF